MPLLVKCPTSRSNVCTAACEAGRCHLGSASHPAHLNAGRVQVDKALSHLSHPGALQYVWVLSTHTVLGLFAPFYGPVLEAIARISTLILVRLRGALVQQCLSSWPCARPGTSTRPVKTDRA